MSAELELIREFRAEDRVVDANSEERARAALLEHIAGNVTGKPRNGRRWPRVVGGRFRAELVAVALATLVVVGVGAVLLSIGSKRPQAPARHTIARRQQSLVIRNFAPGAAPALPGRTVCTGELTPRGLSPGGLFYMTTCQFQSPGIGGSPHGMFRASSAKVDGVNQYRFLITASGLPRNPAGSAYAVWLVQAAQRAGTAGTYRLLEPQIPRLLGVIEPGVGRDGKLAAEGSVPPDLLGSDYLLLITLQPHRSTSTPAQTVLHGFVSLSIAGS